MHLLEIGSTHALHMWLGIPIIIRLFMDDYDPSGRVFHSPENRSLCCGIIFCAVLVTYLRNPARRLCMEDDADDIIIHKKPSFLSRLAESASNTVNSSSSSMFRNALFISILFWFGWPQKSSLSYAMANANDYCEADDHQCRLAYSNNYGPPICGISPSFCDAKAHNWIYQQGGTAQAYKPDAPISKTICDPEEVRSKKMRHKVATWPYSRSGRKNPPELKVKLNLLRCSNDHSMSERTQAEEATEETQVVEESLEGCCCNPLIPSGSQENATIEVWQSRPDGTYSSLRQGSDNGECRAKWIATGSPDVDHVLDPPSTIEFQTMAPGSTGVMSGLGPDGWEFYPYGPPVLHVLVRPGVDGISPLLVDIPLPVHHKTLQERPFTWTDWRGPSWMKAKGHPEQPAFNVTSWEADVDNNSVSISVDLFLHDDKDYSLSYAAATSKLMCPSLFYGLPSSFFLEPISVCGKYLLDYFDL